MGRSGYSDDCENIGLWRGAVESAIRGKRGQALLREMVVALDAMPVKELIADDIVRDGAHGLPGGVCAIGAVAVSRGLDITHLDVHDGDAVAQAFGVARALACEVAYENDDGGPFKGETPAERWQRMRAWASA